MYLSIKAYSINSFLEFYNSVGGDKRYSKDVDIIFDDVEFYGTKITFYKNLNIFFNGPLSKELDNKLHLIIDKNLYVGVDEVGVGESIGPIVVCGVNFNSYENKRKVILNGIKDSKKLNYEDIRDKADFIKKYSEYYCAVMEPTKFNEIYKAIPNVKNINALLQNEIHNKFRDRKFIHITDQFVNINKYNDYLSGRENINIFDGKLIFTTKAEDKYVEVAAAAIIAKDKFNTWVVDNFKNDGVNIDIGNKLNSWGIYLKLENNEIVVPNKNIYIKKWTK